MKLVEINNVLSQVRAKLESLDPRRVDEAQKKPSEHQPDRMAAAKKRLQALYSKNTKGRSDVTKVKGSGASR